MDPNEQINLLSLLYYPKQSVHSEQNILFCTVVMFPKFVPRKTTRQTKPTNKRIKLNCVQRECTNCARFAVGCQLVQFQ